MSVYLTPNWCNQYVYDADCKVSELYRAHPVISPLAGAKADTHQAIDNNQCLHQLTWLFTILCLTELIDFLHWLYKYLPVFCCFSLCLSEYFVPYQCSVVKEFDS